MGISQKQQTKLSILVCLIFSVLYIYLTKGEFNITTLFSKELLIAILPNLIASLLTFYFLSHYLGIGAEFVEEIFKSTVKQNESVNKEISKLKDLQNFSLKFNTGIEHYVALSHDYSDLMNNKAQLDLLKEEFKQEINAKNAKSNEILEKIIKEPNYIEKRKLTDEMNKIIIETDKIKDKLNYIQKIITNLDISNDKILLENQLKNKDIELIKLKNIISELEQEKIRRESEIKEAEELRRVISQAKNVLNQEVKK